MRILLYIALSLFFITQAMASYEIKNIKVLEVNSSINPATLNYLKNHLNKLKPESFEAALIKLNTPGGLVSTTKEIITIIGKLKVPVFIWITPEGASASSAGAIIASSSHLLFMSAGTSIGAATPVGLGKDLDKSDGRDKAINDLVALVKSLSIARGRNPDKFESMITKAQSFDAVTAEKENIINAVINNTDELIKFINGKTIKIQGESTLLSTSKYIDLKNYDMDPGQSLLNIFANPMTAYILFMVGAALLYFEFQAPGGFIAGAVGAICLILAAIGFQVLPLNYGALGLIALSFVLFLLEAYITSYGVLSISGIASLIAGSLFLFRTENAYIDIHLPMILSVVAAITLYILGIGYMIFLSKSKDEIFFKNTNQVGSISKFLGMDGDLFQYQVKVGGEIWKTNYSSKLKLGQKVKITKQNDNLMNVSIETIQNEI